MDVFTHALVALAVARVALPRPALGAWAAILIAGTIADIDALSALLGPSTYLTWHRTYAHSLSASLVTAAVLTVVYLLLAPPGAAAANTPASQAGPSNPSVRSSRVSALALFVTALLAAWLHLALDACQSDGIMLFWPFSSRRVALDWLADVDPWIIAILIAAILLPELLRLVSAEIGSRDKSPRGRLGATIGLVFVIFYVGARATLHANVVGQMLQRSYHGESPRRVAAFPESASLFTWHGIAETSSALHEMTVNVAPGSSFDPENSIALFKPENSPMLDHAQNSDAAQQFLSVARFPKATVEKTSDGFEVQLRDLRYAATAETHREIAALVKTDADGKLVDDALLWARDLQRR
jgi:membrane-bound metal-dependent hydrolase YbcI (DUF457 family)